jgi:hypothetical protein
MMGTASKGLYQFAIALIATVVITTTSRAGLLNGHVDAYSGVTGSVPFLNAFGLSGNIDYAVFTSADFNTNFSGLGYVPAGPLVYTYQVEVTGSLGVSAEIVGITNPANTIGTFDIGDVNATSASFTPNARWLFSPEIPTGMSSWGLAFSSPNLPIIGGALTVDGGTSSFDVGVPTPGTISIPEPTTLMMVCVAGFGVCFGLRRLRH